MIHYEILGTFPQVQHLDVQETIARFETKVDFTSVVSVQNFADALRDVVQVAGHFFGLVTSDFDTLRGLVGAMKAMDQELAVS